MGKIKRTVSLFVLLMFTVLLCFGAVGCKSKTLEEEDNFVASDEGSSYGLYTNLALSLDGGDGKVWATVKNTFTLFPSAVTVKVELYNSDTYKESYTDMTLVASNYVSDLDYGKSVTAEYSTNGKSSYWKARMYYRIDKDGWQERVTNTALFDTKGITTGTSADLSSDREYYISDFLTSEAESAQVSIYPYIPDNNDNGYSFVSRATAWIENEEELLKVKNLFGEVKLNYFDTEAVIKGVKAINHFTSAQACPGYSLKISSKNDEYIEIFINDSHKDILGANLYVYYSNGKTQKYFIASISDETSKSLKESAKNLYENQNREYCISDFLPNDAKSISARMRGAPQKPNAGEIRGAYGYFSIDNEDIDTVKDLFGEVKLNPFDVDAEINGRKGKDYFSGARLLPPLELNIWLNEEDAVTIIINDCCLNTLGVNLYVSYYPANEASLKFVAKIEEDTKNSLRELACDLYLKFWNVI